MKRHESKRKPIVVKVGSAIAKIYQGKSGGYDLFTVAYYLNGHRKRDTFGKLADARAHGVEVATQIARGRLDMLTLTNSDRESYVMAIERLQPFGIPLHAAIEEYASAREQLNGEGLMGVVRDFNARRRLVEDRSVGDIVSELLAVKKRDGLSMRYLQTLRSHLNRFAASFVTNIGSVTAKLIDDWLTRQNLGPRARNNIRMSIVTLFHFAQARNYLPKGQLTEVEYVPRAKDRGGKIGIFSPKQMANLIDDASSDRALFYALGAFAGLRRAEIERLEWEDINFERSFVEVGKHKAKTATRRLVPIQPNLMQWLVPFRGRKGKLFKTRRDSDRAIAFAKERGIDWPDNGLRHSYGSYRLAATSDAARVALEMGNSVQKLMSNYRELADEHDAKAWFAISPRQPRNAVALPAG
jgi:integrase